MKRCNGCGNSYPRTPEFWHRNKRVKDGLNRICKSCNRAVGRENYHKNIEQNKARRKAYYDENRSKALADADRWAKENRWQVKANTANYRAAQVNAEGKLHGVDLAGIYMAQDFLCYYCYCHLELEDCRVDHYIPLARGGSNDPKNIRITCHDCNAQKEVKLPWVFLEERAM